MNPLPNMPRTWSALALRLLVALLAAVPPYLVLAFCDLPGLARALAALVAFLPGIAAILWASRRG
jgi:hypothetical protein